MKFLIGFFLFVSVVLEATVSPFPFTLMAMVVLIAYLQEEALSWVFFGGLLLDMFTLRVLGLSSLFFLAVLWIIIRYRRKVDPQNTLYLLSMIVAIAALYQYLFYRVVPLLTLPLFAIAGSIYIFLMRQIFPGFGKKGKLAV